MEKNALWLLCVLVLPVIACGNKEDDLVTGLPGQPPVNFRHYSGYVNLGPRQKQKSLFYWFFEAQQNTARRPLVLWLNGGPGCSAIATGAAQELGPFLVHTKGGNLTFNEFSWNKGHYVSQLAEVIHDRNKKVTRDSRINLKGIMIGNPVINEATDAAGIVDYAWSHALISDEVHKLIHDSCRFGDKLTAQCNKSFTAFTAYAAINIYSIYTPVCLSSSPSSKNHTRVMSDHNLLTSQNIWGRLPYAYDPCTPHYAEKYFNRKDVQVALHANVTNLPYPYTACSSVIKWTEAPTTVIPIIQKLLKGGLRIWIYRTGSFGYSGDTDGRLPVTSTRYSLRKMRLKVESPWSGWVETYAGGLTFVTVRGAGHQVPLFAPAQSLTLFSHFLASLPLPSSRF
ncbi:unnamed protein product [Brassica rapa]|uniref:Carboxypeptidase n=1 Tax=Brassica campestris TaxID=3711 RepID=A0A8D9I5W1_BRACM|nr:unnamed protein product [Brassica rapa]